MSTLMTATQRQEWPHIRNLYLTATREELVTARNYERSNANECKGGPSRVRYYAGRAEMFQWLIEEHDVELRKTTPFITPGF